MASKRVKTKTKRDAKRAKTDAVDDEVEEDEEYDEEDEEEMYEIRTKDMERMIEMLQESTKNAVGEGKSMAATLLRQAKQKLSEAKYNDSMTAYTTVQENEINDQESKYEMLAKDQAFRYEMRIKDLERIAEVLEERIQKTIAIKKLEALELLHQAERRLVEEKSKAAELLHQAAMQKVRLEGQLETQKAQLEIAKLSAAAEIAALQQTIDAQSRRIRKLEYHK